MRMYCKMLGVWITREEYDILCVILKATPVVTAGIPSVHFGGWPCMEYKKDNGQIVDIDLEY